MGRKRMPWELGDVETFSYLLPIMVFLMDETGKVLWVNERGLNILGHTDLEGEMVISVFHPDDRESVLIQFKNCLENVGKIFKWRFKKVTKDGRVIHVGESARCVLNKRGEKIVLVVCEDITKIIETEETHRAFVESTSDLAFLKRDGRYLMANNAVHAFFQTNAVVGKTDPDLMSKEAAEYCLETDKKTIEQGGILITEEAVGERIFETRKFIVPLGHGKKGVGCYARDITVQKNIERQLIEEKSRFQLLVDRNPQAIAMIDKEGHYIYVNPKFKKMFGYSLDEIPDRKTWMEKVYLNPAYREEVRNSWEIGKEINPGEIRTITSEIVCKDGNIKFIQSFMTVLEEGSEETAKYILFHEDITEKEETERALKESEEMFRNIFEGSIDGQLIISPDKKIVEANDSALKILGITSKESIIGKHPADISPKFQPDGSDSFLKATGIFQNAELYAASRPFEWLHLKEDGSNVCVEVSVTPFIQEGETFFHIFWRNLHEKKLMEAQLLHAQKMEAMGTLAGGIAHDFNNILTAIAGYATLISLGLDKCDCPNGTGGTLSSYTKIIIESSQRAAGLTQQLLIFSRRKNLEIKEFSMKNMLSSLKKMLRRIVREHIELDTIISEDIELRADPTQVEQVIMNLVVNSQDAMLRGGKIEIEIDKVKIDRYDAKLIQGSREGSFACIRVSDNGSGINEETMKKIFDPFFTTKEIGKGTGLGLSLVYAIVQQHKGFVTVDSKINIGSTFKVYLPLTIPENKKTSPQPGFARNFHGHGETILMVEDDETAGMFASSLLRGMNFEVISARNSKDALDLFEENISSIDLVISDVCLPGPFNGIDLIESITRKKKIKFILMSGYPDTESNVEEITARGYPFIQKPYSLETFQKVLREVLYN